ncbi:MAG: hypothetical protein GF419_07815 [Ignavibacteriales bacterium]|nr:hypothetical protein [Ignavibacteriales bacterium]
MTSRAFEPLSREEVAKAIEKRNPSRIPLALATWFADDFAPPEGETLDRFERFPQDVVHLWIEPIPLDRMGLSWRRRTDGALDARAVLDDWSKLEEFVEKLPLPEEDAEFERLADQADRARKDDRYTLFGWWNFFFERLWSLRGMENALVEFYTEPDATRRLLDALRRHYLRYLERAADLLRPDGFFTSDDLGGQRAPTMSGETFREFFFPAYRAVGEFLDRRGLHFWLHSCGNNEPYFEDLIEAGVDVFHPVQKSTMDQREIVERYGDRLSFFAGFDVQKTLREASPEGVREETRRMIDLFDGERGGMILGAGNGIVSGTPLENVAAFVEEALDYGASKRAILAD